MNVLEKILEEIKEKKIGMIDMSDEEPALCDADDWLEEGEKIGKMKAYQEIEKIIRSHMHEILRNDWIKINDHIPEEGQEVWVSTKMDCVHMGMYTKRYGIDMREGFMCNDGFVRMDIVIAWMPYTVPDPYRPDTEVE